MWVTQDQPFLRVENTHRIAAMLSLSCSLHQVVKGLQAARIEEKKTKSRRFWVLDPDLSSTFHIRFLETPGNGHVVLRVISPP